MDDHGSELGAERYTIHFQFSHPLLQSPSTLLRHPSKFCKLVSAVIRRLMEGSVATFGETVMGSRMAVRSSWLREGARRGPGKMAEEVTHSSQDGVRIAQG